MFEISLRLLVGGFQLEAEKSQLALIYRSPFLEQRESHMVLVSLVDSVLFITHFHRVL